MAAIAMAFQQENSESYLKILTDNSFCTSTIRNYTIDPESYKHHLHKDLLQLTDQLLRARDTKHFHTHISKVKSHTGI